MLFRRFSIIDLNGFLILTGHFVFLWRFPLTTRSKTSVPRPPLPAPRFSNIPHPTPLLLTRPIFSPRFDFARKTFAHPKKTHALQAKAKQKTKTATYKQPNQKNKSKPQKKKQQQLKNTHTQKKTRKSFTTMISRPDTALTDFISNLKGYLLHKCSFLLQKIKV